MKFRVDVLPALPFVVRPDPVDPCTLPLSRLSLVVPVLSTLFLFANDYALPANTKHRKNSIKWMLLDDPHGAKPVFEIKLQSINITWTICMISMFQYYSILTFFTNHLNHRKNIITHKLKTSLWVQIAISQHKINYV